ncbi:MAG: hypothetical protein HY901_29330 [Deltaproteobacteria bacterium]|nr:hypothetical protein [Deltaproteobacteria bacterium]
MLSLKRRAIDLARLDASPFRALTGSSERMTKMNTSRLLRTAIFAVASINLSGCVATVAESFRQNGARRAAFDLQCPASELKLVALGKRLDDPGVDGSEIGVQGCGRQAVYVKMFAPGGGPWILNSVEVRQPQTTPPSSSLP